MALTGRDTIVFGMNRKAMILGKNEMYEFACKRVVDDASPHRMKPQANKVCTILKRWA